MGIASTTLRLGTKGAGVKNLQKSLNKRGYQLDEDGVFGQKTQAAVQDYQKNNSLAVDGIAGKDTMGSLAGSNKGQQSGANAGKTTTKKAPAADEGFSYDAFNYGDYAPSDTVVQAQAALQAAQAAKPGAYASQWQGQINDILARISGREDFSYDVDSDALYQQYKDQYIQQGQMAMQDTMGQAAAMTGGYGNSYAASVGNQAYQGYLQQLNDKVPELAQMAYNRYQQEGQDMLNLYSLYSDQENLDYGRYRDSMNDYLTERDYATSQYESERSYDYGKYADERSFDYGVYADDRNLAYDEYRNQIADDQWQTQYDESVRQYNEQFEYGKERDKVADSQWQQTHALNVNADNRDAEAWALEKQAYEESKQSGNQSAALEHVSAMSSADLVDTMQDYSTDEDYQGLASFLDDCVATGRLSEEQADNYYAKYYKQTPAQVDTTVKKNQSGRTGGGAGRFGAHFLKQ